MPGTTYVEQLNIVEPLEPDGGSGESLVRSPDGKIRKGTGGGGGSQNLQQTLENGSTGTVESDILIQHSTGENTASIGLTDGYVSASAGDNQFGLNEQEGSFTSQLRIFERLIVMSGGSSAEVAFSGTELNFIIDGIVRGSINAEGRLTIVNEDGFSGRFAPDNLTGSRTFALPDEDGTLALRESNPSLATAILSIFNGETNWTLEDQDNLVFLANGVQQFSLSTGGAFSFTNASGFSGGITPTDLTSNRTFYLPNSDGTIALQSYVDNAIAGLTFKTNVKAATTANIAIASAPASVDGVTLTNGDRVLLKNQTDATQNGIYIFNGTGSNLTRSTDADTGTELANKTIPIDQGTVNADSWWTVTNDSITLGTTNITLSKTAGQGLYNAGTGIDITGSTISISSAYTSARDAYADGRVAQTITNGVTTSAPSQDAVFDALALKANIDSPTFTGVPSGPTAAAGTNTTQFATTEFVRSNKALDRNFSITANATISTSATNLPANGMITYFCNAASGAITLTLAGASNLQGYTVHVIKTDSSANAVTIQAPAGVNINAANTFVLANQYERANIKSNATQFYLF